MKISKKRIFIFLFILSLVLNIFLLFNKEIGINGNSVSETSFRYIEPIENQPIDSNIQDDRAILHYLGLKEILEQKIKEYNATGKVGIFLQDAQTGAWMGINEKEGYSLASLLKIPIMMEILKKVELDEISLNDKITILPGDIEKEGTITNINEEDKISISNLLKEMISSSSNTAKNALKRQMSFTEINTVFAHVGIPNPYIPENNEAVSPRGYTRLFKSLYYSTFLSPKLSELAIGLTTDGQEENLISGGVPTEIQVAHKFGIIYDESLHDCGIVYHPRNPYFLCIMTKDLELKKGKELIPILSKEIFDFINSK